MSKDSASAPADPEPEPGTPGLHWSIKTSFLEYIFRMPDGRYSVTDGAAVIDGQVFYFSPDDGPAFDPVTADGVLKFRGDVRFAGHHGFLFIRVADPWLTVERGVVTLSIASLPGETPDRVPLATLELRSSGAPHGPDHYRGGSVRLTEQGSELFNMVYPPGEPFDDLTVIRLTAGAAEQMP